NAIFEEADSLVGQTFCDQHSSQQLQQVWISRRSRQGQATGMLRRAQVAPAIVFDRATSEFGHVHGSSISHAQSASFSDPLNPMCVCPSRKGVYVMAQTRPLPAYGQPNVGPSEWRVQRWSSGIHE